MSTIKLRPSFSILLSKDSNEILAKVRKTVAANSGEFLGRFTTGHAMISFVESKRHFWSPWLNLEIRESDTGKILFGRFSPHPSIWTGFMFSYLALGVLSFFSLVLGLSQQLASESPWGYALIPLWAVVAIALWIASQAGQRLAVDEMTMMQKMIEEAVG